MEERYSQQKRYGMSIRKIVKKKIAGGGGGMLPLLPPRTLPPLADPPELARDAVSKSVVLAASGIGGKSPMPAGGDRAKMPMANSVILETAEESLPLTENNKDDKKKGIATAASNIA